MNLLGTVQRNWRQVEGCGGWPARVGHGGGWSGCTRCCTVAVCSLHAKPFPNLQIHPPLPKSFPTVFTTMVRLDHQGPRSLDLFLTARQIFLPALDLGLINSLDFVQLAQHLIKSLAHFPSAVWRAEQECHHFR